MCYNVNYICHVNSVALRPFNLTAIKMVSSPKVNSFKRLIKKLGVKIVNITKKGAVHLVDPRNTTRTLRFGGVCKIVWTWHPETGYIRRRIVNAQGENTSSGCVVAQNIFEQSVATSILEKRILSFRKFCQK